MISNDVSTEALITILIVITIICTTLLNIATSKQIDKNHKNQMEFLSQIIKNQNRHVNNDKTIGILLDNILKNQKTISSCINSIGNGVEIITKNQDSLQKNQKVIIKNQTKLASFITNKNK
jgi:hypothetical protein